MKRVFKFKKDAHTDWDEPLYYFLSEYLCKKEQGHHNLDVFKKNWKVTIIVEEEK